MKPNPSLLSCRALNWWIRLKYPAMAHIYPAQILRVQYPPQAVRRRKRPSKLNDIDRPIPCSLFERSRSVNPLFAPISSHSSPPSLVSFSLACFCDRSIDPKKPSDRKKEKKKALAARCWGSLEEGSSPLPRWGRAPPRPRPCFPGIRSMATPSPPGTITDRPPPPPLVWPSNRAFSVPSEVRVYHLSRSSFFRV